MQLPKPLNLLWEKETIPAGVLRGVMGVLCLSLYYQSLGTLLVTLRLQKIVDLRLNKIKKKKRKLLRSSVLHMVMSSLYSLPSEAGVKPLGSHTVPWETWDPNLPCASSLSRVAGDCFALSILILGGWAELQFRLHMPNHHCKVRTHSGVFKQY